MNTISVSTDTDMLRAHARDLEYFGDLIDSGSAALSDSIAAEHWVHQLHLALLNTKIALDLRAFFREFQRAHDGTRARLIELAETYHTAGAGLRIVADQYDAADR